MTKHKFALNALIRLHVETGAKLKENHKQAKRLAQDMKHVEAVIRMLAPGYDTRHMGHRRRFKPNPWFRKGEGYRGALDILRKAERPLTAPEIAKRMLAIKGVTDATPKQITMLAGAVRMSLRNHEGNAVVRVGEGMPMRWQLIAK